MTLAKGFDHLKNKCIAYDLQKTGMTTRFVTEIDIHSANDTSGVRFNLIHVRLWSSKNGDDLSSFCHGRCAKNRASDKVRTFRGDGLRNAISGCGMNGRAINKYFSRYIAGQNLSHSILYRLVISKANKDNVRSLHGLVHAGCNLGFTGLTGSSKIFSSFCCSIEDN